MAEEYHKKKENHAKITAFWIETTALAQVILVWAKRKEDLIGFFGFNAPLSYFFEFIPDLTNIAKTML